MFSFYFQVNGALDFFIISIFHIIIIISFLIKSMFEQNIQQLISTIFAIF